ncbi:unnamed protein product [Periconia digitata]|uniref:Uncharacterized protein n=1 Tax=Periconia digitata TaxID=1303443 RepID=A0A9W4UUD9_9PLEO|nr:unnamed protein product [Periconia digitata]
MYRFDPKLHLVAKQPSKVHLLTDLGYKKDIGVSPMAASEAFQLFTPEAIQIMRKEIQKPQVHKNHSFSSNIAACQLRGYAKDHAPFTYEAWNHPDTLKFMSSIAGIDIVPAMDYEIAHINHSVKVTTASKDQSASRESLSNNKTDEDDDEKPIVGWHTDSYPFVCVLMMSDCTGMVGGETAVRTADGRIIKIRGPTQGCAVMLQGRYILHQAMRARGAQERITSVTSFRPKSALAPDDTELRTVRPVSNLSELYYDFAEYRLKMMEERVEAEREKMRAHRVRGDAMDTLEHKEFLGKMVRFAEQSDRELVEEGKVQKGYIV